MMNDQTVINRTRNGGGSRTVASGGISTGSATIDPKAHSPLLETRSETKIAAPVHTTASPEAARNPTPPSDDPRPTVIATTANASQATSSRAIDRRASVTNPSMALVRDLVIRACTEGAIVECHEDRGATDS